MRYISEWQILLKEAADKKFPANQSGKFCRVTSLQNQLDDIKAALQVENGELESDHHAHQDPNHRIGALIADALILAHERGANMEEELEVVLAWFIENTEGSN